MPSAVAPPPTVPNPLAPRRGLDRSSRAASGTPAQPGGRPALTPRGRRAAALAGALGGGAMAVSFSVTVTALLLLAFGGLFLSVFGGVTAASIEDAPSGSSAAVALGRLLADAFGSATALVLVLLGAMLLVGAAGAGLSAWLLRDFGVGRAWAITAVGWLISCAADALLATSATGLLTAPVASLLPLLPVEVAGSSDAPILLTMLGFVIAIRIAVVIGLSAGSWILAARLLRPLPVPRASGP